MTAISDFLADKDSELIWAAILEPYNPGSGTTTTLYFSTGEYMTEPGDTPANQAFKAQLIQGWNYQRDAIQPGTVGVVAGRKGGELRLGQRYGGLDYLGTYYWDGRAVTIKVGGRKGDGTMLAYADWHTIKLESAGIEVGVDEVVVRLRDPDQRFDFPLEDVTYSGSDWMLYFNGGTDVVTFGSPAKLNITGDLTVLARCSFTSFSAANALAGWANSFTTYPFAVWTGTAGDMRYQNSALAGAVDTVGTLSLNVRYSLLWTVTGTALVMSAWNEDTGAQVFSETFTLSSGSHPSGDGNFRVGQTNTISAPGLLLDWLQVHNAVLTADQVADYRRRQLTAAEESSITSLKLYLRCEEGTGTTITDYSASPANGTASGTDWYPSLGGGSTLAGTPKPNGFGLVEDASPVLVYAPTRIYQIHRAQVSSVTSSYEGGSAHTFGSAYTTPQTFLAATTTAAQYDTLIYSGGSYIRLGSNPTLPVTVTFAGDASGSGYVSTAGDIARRIMCTRGPRPITDPGGLNTTSFTDLNTANSTVVGYYTTEEVTIADALSEILGSIGAVVYCQQTDGLFAVFRFNGVTRATSLTLTEADIIEISEIPAATPAWKVTLDYERCWTPLGQEQTAAAITGTATQLFLSNEWRTVAKEQVTTRTLYPSAQAMRQQSLITTLVGAQAEVSRKLTLFGTRHKGYQVLARAKALQPDLFDTVTISLADESYAGAAQNRLNLGAGTDVVVLGSVGIEQSGTVQLTVWG